MLKPAVRVVARTVVAAPRSVRSLCSSSVVTEQQLQSLNAISRETVPQKEIENVSRIERLMSLSNKFSAASTELNKPRRVRGVGYYSETAPAPAIGRQDLPPLPSEKRMKDSYVQLDLKFSEDRELREQYVGGHTSIRMGRLMEDFDTLAGAAAYRHVLPEGLTAADASAYGLYLVTAAVDRMDMLRPLANANGDVPDLRLSGHVSYATESSLEVFIRLSTLPTSPSTQSETILLGRFAMACRSMHGGKQKIAKLLVEGEEEQALWTMGREMKDGKKARQEKSLEKRPPSEREAKMMHDVFIGMEDLFKRNAATPENVVWMSDTKLNSALMMHPQERNVHLKVFGGYLMRLAYETAYSTACLYAKTPVTFIALDELQFRLPVDIGSLLTLNSMVTFAPMEGEHRSFHVSVDAGTTDLQTGEKRVTNIFHFTFASDQPLKRHVLPRSYKQSMRWLEAQRRRENGIQIRRSYDSTS